MIEKTALADALGVPDVTIEMLVKMDLLTGPRDHVTPDSLERLAFRLTEFVLRQRAKETRAEAERRVGYVYIAWCTGTQLIKIGHSVDPVTRVSSLNTGNPDGIMLVAMTPGSRLDERAAHRALGEYRVTKEWFRPSDPVTAFAIAVQEGRTIPEACNAAYEAQVRAGIAQVSHKNAHNNEAADAK